MLFVFSAEFAGLVEGPAAVDLSFDGFGFGGTSAGSPSEFGRIGVDHRFDERFDGLLREEVEVEAELRQVSAFEEERLRDRMPFGSVVVQVVDGAVRPVGADVPWQEVPVDEAVAVESR